MAVKKEIKSQLAKLLATEDLVVEHKHVQTACFNVHTRVLTLPMWEKASNTVYDLLVGHEVGHALFTPDEDWLEKVAVPPQFVNVVEDARIEKLMKRKYAGLAKTFFNGYRELNDQDFFSISDESIANFNLADRANLYFKIGNFVNVHFDEFDESLIIKKISDVETFDDALRVAEELYLHCKKEKEEKVDDITPPPEIGGESETPANELVEDSGESSEKGETEGAGDDNQPISSGDQPATAPLSDDPEVQTADALQENLQDLVGSDTSHENVYVEIPQVDLKYIIAKNDDVHKEIDLWFNHQQNNIGLDFNIFGKVDDEFIGFKRSAQKEVNYLVKEFECRKAADSYARATTARTGVLDTTKLHTYKYNEDLFKKVTTLADGKNHGLVFVLDWSGSMQDVMMDTIKQLYNLIWFCKKVSIPFDVYAFTSDYPRFDPREGRDWQYDRKDGTLHVPDYFSMMNLFTSKTNGKTLEVQMKNIFRVAYSFRHYCGYFTPYGLGLSGTPLNESLVSLYQILPKFKQDHKLQKVQCVILTDGDGCMTKYDRELQRRWEDEPFIGTASIRHNAFLRNRKTGNTYSLDCPWYEFTDILLRDLKETFKNINFIGMRIMPGRDAGSFIRRYCGYYGDEFERNMNSWKKVKSCTITTSGYHKYFGLSSQHISQETDFDVKEDATKAQIKSAFKKSLSTKKMNKKVLSEFVELIA